VGVDWGFTLTPPQTPPALIAGQSTTFQLGLRNIGTETDDIRFEAVGPGRSVVTGPPGWMTVNRGVADSVELTVTLPADSTLIGLHNISVTAHVRHSADSVSTDVTVHIQPRASMRLNGPQGGSISMAAGSSGQITVMAFNAGTINLSFDVDWSGLPLGATIVPTGQLANELAPASATALTYQLTLAEGVLAGSYNLQFVVGNQTTGVTYATTSIDLHVSHFAAVRLLAAVDKIPVGSVIASIWSVTVVNGGNQPDSITIAIEEDLVGFEVAIEPLYLQLGAGESGSLTVTLRRSGLTATTISATLLATSSNNPTQNASLTFSIIEQESGASLTLSSSAESVVVGQSFSATLWLQNTGNADETYRLESTGYNCSLPESTNLSTSAAPSSLEITCQVATGTLAGVRNLSVTAIPVTDPDAAVTAVLALTVAAQRVAGQPPLIISIDTSRGATIPYRGALTISVTLTNSGNEVLAGTLFLGGEDAQAMQATWKALPSGSSIAGYNLAPGESATFQLNLQPVEPAAGERTFSVDAVATDHLISSQPFILSVEGEHQPPAGLLLPFGLELDNQSSLSILSAGWILALLLIAVMRLTRKRSSRKEGDPLPGLPALDLDELDLPPAPATKSKSGQAEVSVDAAGKVTCPGCQTRLKTPANKDPPFKFKCPKCSESVRVIATP
jgi:uncharacterized membrane protein